MKLYELLADGRFTDEYHRGLMSGIIAAISSDCREDGDIWTVSDDGVDHTFAFLATEEECLTIRKILERECGKGFVGIREVR